MTPRSSPHILFALTSLANLPYHVSTITELSDLGAKVTVLFCRHRKETKNVPGERSDDPVFLAWVDAIPARHPNLTFLEEERRPGRRFWLRTLRSYSHYLRRLGPGNTYTERWRRYLPRGLLALTSLAPVQWLLRTELAFRRLTAIEKWIPPDRGIEEWIAANDVDAVVASPTNRHNTVPAEFVKAARRRGVSTAVPVLTWDSLSTKGLIPCPPEMLLAWNDAHAEDAIGIHALDPESVVVAGSPFFDKWFRDEELEPRSELLASLGLHSEARYLLYLGSSTMIAFNESWLVREVRETLDRAALSDLELVVRPHPANDRLVRDLEGLPQVHVDGRALPFSEEMQRHFAAVVRYAEAFVGINTSGMLDAIILDRPGFSILVDDYRETQLEAPHFRHLLDADALYLEPDLDSFARRLAAVAAGDDPKAAQRAEFVRRFVRPRGVDVSAGRIQAEAIVLLAQGRSPTEIDAILSRRGTVGAQLVE